MLVYTSTYTSTLVPIRYFIIIIIACGAPRLGRFIPCPDIWLDLNSHLWCPRLAQNFLCPESCLDFCATDRSPDLGFPSNDAEHSENHLSNLRGGCSETTSMKEFWKSVKTRKAAIEFTTRHPNDIYTRVKYNSFEATFRLFHIHFPLLTTSFLLKQNMNG